MRLTPRVCNAKLYCGRNDVPAVNLVGVLELDGHARRIPYGKGEVGASNLGWLSERHD